MIQFPSFQCNPFIYQYRKHIANFIEDFRAKTKVIIEQRRQKIINQSDDVPEDMLTAMIKSCSEYDYIDAVSHQLPLNDNRLHSPLS